MATPETAPVDEQRPPDSDRDGTLEPFHGQFVPGLCFESGHCLWLLEFTATPTQFDSYTELWLITPTGERILYTDPGDAAEEVLKHHDFDRTESASITCDGSPSRIDVTMEAADDTTIELTASLTQTLATRVLNAVIAVTPAPVLQSGVGTTISTASMNLLLDANGLKIAGRTETSRRYRLESDRLARIQDASATLDGTDLGALTPPSRPIEFGDARTPGDAIYARGTVRLERFDRSES